MNTKKQIMDSNKFKRELLLLKKNVEQALSEREYQEWKKKTDDAISKINARIRASN